MEIKMTALTFEQALKDPRFLLPINQLPLPSNAKGALIYDCRCRKLEAGILLDIVADDGELVPTRRIDDFGPKSKALLIKILGALDILGITLEDMIEGNDRNIACRQACDQLKQQIEACQSKFLKAARVSPSAELAAIQKTGFQTLLEGLPFVSRQIERLWRDEDLLDKLVAGVIGHIRLTVELGALNIPFSSFNHLLCAMLLMGEKITDAPAVKNLDGGELIAAYKEGASTLLSKAGLEDRQIEALISRADLRALLTEYASSARNVADFLGKVDFTTLVTPAGKAILVSARRLQVVGRRPPAAAPPQ